MLSVFITCSTSAINAERRFDPSTGILKLKGMIEIITGAPADALDLRLYDAQGNELCSMNDDSRTIGDYPVENFMRIHAINTSARAVLGEFDDVSKVEKFELSEEEYAKRRDTVRAFKERNQIGRFNPELAAKAAEQSAQRDAEGQDKAATIAVGNRCEVCTSGQPSRRGTVKFVGKTKFQQGYWVGVQYDEPYGKHNGTVEGVSYFTCPDKYGALVRPAAVEVGDFPEENFDDDEM